ncbi:hypothetical protein [Dyadobacter sp. CY312]|uniref:hypothetical protein n=1 Tax=Dyadobacter sp. CY312 TaxID=2907303 RepID=UPI001F312048|nr:hypothetical protein [Dyadobacter sp. CY312]MCE7039115.1 hypothetical protein [Dyadobacter sp. CY312]
MKNKNENDRTVKGVDEVYDNDTNAPNAKAGREEMGSMPNDPAKNAKLTSPEEDEENAKRKKENR